jgi:hypothetical protein
MLSSNFTLPGPPANQIPRGLMMSGSIRIVQSQVFCEPPTR